MSEKLQLEIPLVLPEVSDASDACVERLTAELIGRPGIEDAHILEAPDGGRARLCVHYAPDILTLSRIREIVQAAGAAITERYGHVLWQSNQIGYARQARTLADRLRELPGVLEAEVSAAGTMRIEFDRQKTSQQDLRSALGTLGVAVTTASGWDSPHHHAHEHLEGEQDARKQKERTSCQREASAMDAPDQGSAQNRDEAGDDHTGHTHDGHKHDGSEGKHAEHSHAHGGFLGPNTELIFALICGALLAIGFSIEKFATALPAWVAIGCYLAAYGFGGFFTLREALENIRLKRFEIDTLMLVAAGGAAALGAWAEGALLLFLFSLGHALEHYAMGRAKRAIEALAALAPQTATVRRGDKVLEISVDDLVVGDTVLVKPNERVPADGFLVKGTSSINQAPVTGESIPVDKAPVANIATARSRPDNVDAGSRVFAGTINGSGAIEIEVTRRSSESALAKVVKLVSEAETQRSPTQRFTDKFERAFVPAVLALAFLLLFAWVVVDEPFRDSFYRAMAVLVAASPCALAIATPSAVLSGIARAARGGVLVKGGGPLENLGSLTAIAFDKTGTLTEGRPQITEVVAAAGATEEELLSVAVAVEAQSDHPLAQAVVRDGEARLERTTAIGETPKPTVSDLRSITGKGITAVVDGLPVWVGKAEMFGSDGIAPLQAESLAAITALRMQGRTTMAVRLGERDLGAIGLMDTPRQGAREALDRLRKLGITRMIMISGDNQRVADAVAKQVGLDEAWGDLMPEDKVESIRKLRNDTKVAMVGDGVNDAPAMANATVGIAMGAAGSDVALETADVALMADNLQHLPFAVGLSRHTRSIILQNVFVSLGVVALLVPATIFGLSIGAAVAMHEGSTLLVVFNALRLLAYGEPGKTT